jgi:hypothetical protein
LALVKYGAWEVEEPAMDVQADEAGLRADPHETAVVPRTGALPSQGARTGGQGQLFSDAYPTYADTDRIPAVGKGGRSRARPRPSWLLRFAVIVVAVAVVGAGVALGLVKAGVIDKSSPGSGNGTPAAAPPARHAHSTTPQTPVATQVSTGAGSATYNVDIEAYQVTVTTTTGRSWVSIGAAGQHPAFAGILQPNSSQKEVLLGSSQVDVGAGGTKVIVTSGHRTTTLTPPSAPFSYQLLVKKG